jgi:hypothetical protein
MTERRSGARRRWRSAAACIAATISGGCAWAQTVEETQLPPGFPVGSMYVAPSLTTGASYNSNIFLNTEDLSPTPDQVFTVQPALQLTVPFSNSKFRLTDTLTWVDYQKTPQSAGKTSNDATAELSLRFGSLDRLDLSANRIDGVAETLAFDPGGEVTFDGNSYRLHSEGIAASREVPGARGYRIGLERNVLSFDQATNVFFFNYSGFDAEAAYLQPLSSNTRLAFGYIGSRYDHFDLGAVDPSVVFRSESGDVGYAEVEGQFGVKQPYLLRVGWENLDFTGSDAADFSGIVGEGRLSAVVGGGTAFTVQIGRQPYRSFFENNNFYIYDLLSGRVDRRFPRGSAIGANLTFSKVGYREASPPESDAPGTYRQDRAILIEAYGNLVIREHVIFRLSVVKNRKYSNFPGADYNAIVVFGGFVLGWL